MERVREGVLVATGDTATGAGSGAALGDEDTMGSTCGAGAGTGEGALVVRVGVGKAAGGGAEGAGPDDTAPVSRSTRFGGAVLPAKNSEAVRAGSSEGAGGKMSDWNESD